MTPPLSILDHEVFAAQAGAHPPEKTYINTGIMLDYVREHPAEFPNLTARSDKSAKMEMSKALIRMGFPVHSYMNTSGNRIFQRPEWVLEQLRAPASPGEAQLSAAGGGL